mmetsp:Transcript_66008/g.176876  ORF Transcript_66008/g.176876 Transcript_66008/m.176876 type:complete len:87 (-) Transcript_66008:158-418(-)
MPLQQSSRDNLKSTGSYDASRYDSSNSGSKVENIFHTLSGSILRANIRNEPNKNTLFVSGRGSVSTIYTIFFVRCASITSVRAQVK